MAEIEKTDFNLNITRYVSTAVGESVINLDAAHAEPVAAEQAIADGQTRAQRLREGTGSQAVALSMMGQTLPNRMTSRMPVQNTGIE